jgi:hypothetical protein
LFCVFLFAFCFCFVFCVLFAHPAHTLSHALTTHIHSPVCMCAAGSRGVLALVGC